MINLDLLAQRVRIIAMLLIVLLATPTTAAAVPSGHRQTAPLATASTANSEDFNTSGIPLISNVEMAKPTSEAQAQAISDALEFAQTHPDDVGYPWIDPASGELVLSAATGAGADLLAELSVGLNAQASLRQASSAFGELETIKHEVTTLRAEGVPDADLIYMTGPDPKTNRIVVVVSAPSERLFKALADRFGTDTLELLVDASMLGAQPAANRQADTPPFYGGASIQSQACSDGIPWKIGGSAVAMLTAAHCRPTGGSIKIGSYSSAGTVAASSEENWNSVHGTQYYTGQSVYRGDVALIRLSGYNSAPRIYRGGVDSGDSSSVVSWYQRFAQFGDQVYVSGRASGDTGPYNVDLTGWDILYSPPSDIWARNMSSALRIGGPCATNGDSGGAIFSTVSGGVKSAGIFSGFLICRIYFTPIYDSYLALPGAPLTY